MIIDESLTSDVGNNLFFYKYNIVWLQFVKMKKKKN
jgi:hypothetical protein